MAASGNGRKPHNSWNSKYAVRRLVVLLKHEDASKDRTVFRNEETPNTHTTDDTARAFSVWIKTAREHDVPAVYRAGKGLHLLTPNQIEKMDGQCEFLGKWIQLYLPIKNL